MEVDETDGGRISSSQVRGEPHGMPAQIWALGVLLVEMLTGRAPFWEPDVLSVLQQLILAADPDLVPVPEEARPLARALLAADVAVREANFSAGYADVMRHPWLEHLDWDAIGSGACVPAFDFEEHAQETLAALEPRRPTAREDGEDGAPPSLMRAFGEFDM